MPPSLRRSAVVPIAALLAACSTTDFPTSPPSADAPRPELAVATFGVTTMGTADDGYMVTAINDQGLVVGAIGFGSLEKPIQWINGATQRLPTEAFTEKGQVYDVNAFGVAVGTDGLDGVVWDNGVRSVLADPGRGDDDIIPLGISHAGQIVGIRGFNHFTQPAALLWLSKTDPTPTVLANLEGFRPIPQDVNDAGTIVGDANGFGAVVWSDRFATPQRLKDPDGVGFCDIDGTAASINQRGEIVGYCGHHSNERAAYWPNKDATPVDLGAGFALDINDLGQIVGSIDNRPVLFNREAGQLRAYDLGAAIGDLGTVRVTAVSNTGQAAGEVITTAGSVGMVWRIPIRAELDLVPGSSANAIKLAGKGTVAAVILGSPWFRAADVDPATLTLGNDDGLDTQVLTVKKGTFPVPGDLNGDGFVDRKIEFDKATLVRNGDLKSGTQTLVLLGRTKDGRPIRGTDVVKVTP